MKPSISKLFLAALAALSLSACTDDKPSAPKPAEPAIQTQPQQPAKKPATSEKPAAPAQKTAAKPDQKPVQAAAYTAAQLAERLKAWDKNLQTLSTEFEQSTEYDGVQVTRSRGTLKYDRARNLLRLDTLGRDSGLEQSAVTNKKEIIILDDTGAHVTTLSWTDWQQGQPNQALFDFGNYTALVDKHAAAVESQNGETAVLALTPKEGEEYKLYLTLSKKDFFPQTITVVSELMTTRADLKSVRKNAPLAADTFGGFFK